jgi:hypothetical protein
MNFIFLRQQDMPQSPNEINRIEIQPILKTILSKTSATKEKNSDRLILKVPLITGAGVVQSV